MSNLSVASPVSPARSGKNSSYPTTEKSWSLIEAKLGPEGVIGPRT